MTATEEQIKAALEACGGNVRRAAASLGIPRTTLRRRMKKTGTQVDVVGITPSYSTVNIAQVIKDLERKQDEKEAAIALNRAQTITINDDGPFVLALFSDLHIGNNKADYKALISDTKLVKSCPYCWAVAAGDYSENWIGKLGWIAREQAMTLDTEHALVKWWFDELKGSLVAVCSGNHDNRSIITAGIDYIRMILGDAVLLYDQDQILFTLKTKARDVVVKIRHRDQYRSILNPYHGAYRDIERGDAAWDLYISGHDHKATMYSDYVHHDSMKLICRLGTYKMDDRFGKFLGFAKSHGTGAGAIIVHADGCLQPVRGGIGEAIMLCGAMRGD